MRHKTASFVASVLVVGVISTGTAFAQSSGPAVPPTPTHFPVSSSYTSTDPSNIRSVQANAALCGEFANDPHNSGHVPETINAEIRTTCIVNVDLISQTAQLWESRWWGWDRIGTKGSNSTTFRNNLSTFANAGCRNNNVYVSGSGYVRSGGTNWQASTQSRVVHITC